MAGVGPPVDGLEPIPRGELAQVDQVAALAGPPGGVVACPAAQDRGQRKCFQPLFLRGDHGEQLRRGHRPHLPQPVRAAGGHVRSSQGRRAPVRHPDRHPQIDSRSAGHCCGAAGCPLIGVGHDQRDQLAVVHAGHCDVHVGDATGDGLASHARGRAGDDGPIRAPRGQRHDQREDDRSAHRGDVGPTQAQAHPDGADRQHQRADQRGRRAPRRRRSRGVLGQPPIPRRVGGVGTVANNCRTTSSPFTASA